MEKYLTISHFIETLLMWAQQGAELKISMVRQAVGH